MTRREMDGFIRQLRRDGFTAEVTGGGHWRLTHPGLLAPVFAAATPSDRRAVHKLRTTIRRYLATQPQTPRTLEIPL
jgi:hypothetical protein